MGASDSSRRSPTSSTIRSRAATVLTPVAASTDAASFSGPRRMMTTPRWMNIASSGLTLSTKVTASSVHRWYLMRFPVGVVTGSRSTLDPTYWSAMPSL